METTTQTSGSSSRTQEIEEALKVASDLIKGGVPIFIARAGEEGRIYPPDEWQQTEPNLEVLDRFRDGDMLCMVTGRVFDAIDRDEHHQGDLTVLPDLPNIFGISKTASGGEHYLIGRTRSNNRTNLVKGVDIRAGKDDGTGRGFIFIPPTQKRSKTTFETTSYAWAVPPTPEQIARAKSDVTAEDWIRRVDEVNQEKKRQERPVSPYVAKAVEIEMQNLNRAEEGTRNNQLFTTAASLFGFVKGGHLEQEKVWHQLHSAALDIGLDPSEIAGTLSSAQRKAEPRAIPSSGEYTATPLMKAPGRLSFEPISARPVKKTEWLWTHKEGFGLKGIMPAGELVLLQGYEGTSKSSVSLDIAASLSRGVLPGGLFGRPCATMAFTVEDSVEKTINPRYLAAGGDPSKLFIEKTDGPILMDIAEHIDSIEDFAIQNNVGLLIFDPIISRLGNADTDKDSQVRQSLMPLIALCQRRNITAIGIIHYNKASSARREDRTMGSRAFRAVARATLDVVTDPLDPSCRLLGVGKANLGDLNIPTLRYRIHTHYIPGDGEEIQTLKIEWMGADARRLDEVFDARYEDMDELQQAMTVLGDRLDVHGEISKNDIKKMSREVNIKEAMLDAAIKNLNLVYEMRYIGGDRTGTAEIIYSRPKNQEGEVRVTAPLKRCTVCDQALDPYLTLEGETVHPNCAEDGKLL